VTTGELGFYAASCAVFLAWALRSTRKADQLRQENARLRARVRALTFDPVKLRVLAAWLDLKYPNDLNPEVQADLRRWAAVQSGPTSEEGVT
jgi:hypothetical protein